MIIHQKNINKFMISNVYFILYLIITLSIAYKLFSKYSKKRNLFKLNLIPFCLLAGYIILCVFDFILYILGSVNQLFYFPNLVIFSIPIIIPIITLIWLSSFIYLLVFSIGRKKNL